MLPRRVEFVLRKVKSDFGDQRGAEEFRASAESRADILTQSTLRLTTGRLVRECGGTETCAICVRGEGRAPRTALGIDYS